MATSISELIAIESNPAYPNAPEMEKASSDPDLLFGTVLAQPTAGVSLLSILSKEKDYYAPPSHRFNRKESVVAYDMRPAVAAATAALRKVWTGLHLDHFKAAKPIIAGGMVEHLVTISHALSKATDGSNSATAAAFDLSQAVLPWQTYFGISDATSYDGDMTQPYPPWKAIYLLYADRARNRDVDVFLCYDQADAEQVEKEVREYLNEQYDRSGMVVASDIGYTVRVGPQTESAAAPTESAAAPAESAEPTAVRKKPREISVQLLPSMDQTPESIVNSFDIDCCAAYYDGSQLYALPRAIVSWATRTTFLRPKNIAYNYEKRVAKYFDLGYDLVIEPKYGFDPSRIDRRLSSMGGGILTLLRLISPTLDSFREREEPTHEKTDANATGQATEADGTYFSMPSMPQRWSTGRHVAWLRSEMKIGRAAYHVFPNRSYIECVCGSEYFNDFLDGHYDRRLAELITNLYLDGVCIDTMAGSQCREISAWLGEEEMRAIRATIGRAQLQAKEKAKEMIVTGFTNLKWKSLHDIIYNAIPIPLRRKIHRTQRQSDNWFCYRTAADATPAVADATPAAAEATPAAADAKSDQ